MNYFEGDGRMGKKEEIKTSFAGYYLSQILTGDDSGRRDCVEHGAPRMRSGSCNEGIVVNPMRPDGKARYTDKQMKDMQRMFREHALATDADPHPGKLMEMIKELSELSNQKDDGPAGVMMSRPRRAFIQGRRNG